MPRQPDSPSLLSACRRIHSRLMASTRAPASSPARICAWGFMLLTLLLVTASALAQPANPSSESQLPQPAFTPEQEIELRRAEELSKKCDALFEEGKYKEAIPIAEEVLNIRSRMLGEENPDTAEALNDLGVIFEGLGEYEKAEQYYLQGLNIRQKVLGEDGSETANSLVNLGGLYMEMGAYEKAESMLLQGTTILRHGLGEEQPDTANALNSLGELYIHMGAYEKAEPILLLSLAARRRTLGEGHPSTAGSLSNLAELYRLMGAYDKAEPLHHQSLAIFRRVLGEEHRDTGSALNNLALMYASIGAYEKAEPLYQQNLATRRRVLGENHPSTAISLNNLAELYRSMGAYDRAEPLYQQSLTISRRVLGDEHPDTINSLHNLALLYKQMGAFDRAESLYLQCLLAWRRAVGENHPYTANALSSLGALYASKGEYEKAEVFTQQSLEILQRVLGDSHPATADARNTLASIYHSIGTYEKAERLLVQNLATYRRVIGDEHPMTTTTVRNLASLQLAQHHPEAALPYSIQALAGSLAHHLRVLPTLAGRERLRYLERLQSSRDKFLTATAEAQAPAAESWPFLLRLKGQSLLLETAIARLDQSPDPAHGTLLTELRTQAARVSRLERKGKLGPELEAAREALSESEKKLAAIAMPNLPPEITPQAVLQHLPPGTALIDFHAYDHQIPPEAPGLRGSLERRIAAFIVCPDHPIERVALGPEAPIAELIATWRRAVATGSALEPNSSGLSLRSLLWTPLEQHLAGISTVLISPDGPLALLPFGALPGKDAGRYLLEDYAIALAPVPQLLAQTVPPAQRPSLLTLGDVDYGAEPGKPAIEQLSRSRFRGTDGLTFAALPETRVELDQLTRLFHARFPNAVVDTFRGAAATEASLKPALASHSILHLSTHGFVVPEPAGAEAPARPEMLTRLEGLTGGPVVDPRSRVGLALSGANRVAALEEDDGTLTALEINSLDLRQVDLVVLSACETSLGVNARGEGLLGLQRTFQAAGARSIVSSLWQVKEEQTRHLMARFYRNVWEKKLTRLEALREAQLWMLREGRRKTDSNYRGLKGWWLKQTGALPISAPVEWAAFQLAGVWQE